MELLAVSFGLLQLLEGQKSFQHSRSIKDLLNQKNQATLGDSSLARLLWGVDPT